MELDIFMLIVIISYDSTWHTLTDFFLQNCSRKSTVHIDLARKRATAINGDSYNFHFSRKCLKYDILEMKRGGILCWISQYAIHNIGYEERVNFKATGLIKGCIIFVLQIKQS